MSKVSSRLVLLVSLVSLFQESSPSPIHLYIMKVIQLKLAFKLRDINIHNYEKNIFITAFLETQVVCLILEWSL